MRRSRRRGLSTQGDSTPRDRAADQHVSSRRERSAHGLRLAAGDSRLGRPVAVHRRRRMDVAPAEQSARLLRFNSYLDENPRGFGLLQRDRDFEQLPGRRRVLRTPPSLWVEPKSPWGESARCSSPRSRPSMKPSTTSSRSGIPADAGQGRRRAAVQLPHVLGHADARVLDRSREAVGDAHGPGRRRRTAAPIFLVALRGRFRRRRARDAARNARRSSRSSSVSRGTVEVTSARPLQHDQRLSRACST